MKILVRNNNNQGWQLVESAGYAGETELQGLLAESPSLISIDEIREGAPPLMVAVREFGLPGSGQTDLLAFNAQGDIAIVECKLAANPEIKRKVIAQVLEYGAYLWKMTYEELNDRIFQRKSAHLAELVSTAVNAPEWTPAEFGILLRSPSMSVGALHLKLPKRTPDAVQIVCSGIRTFHTGKNTSMLSKKMLRRLEVDTAGPVYPICEMQMG